MVLGPLRNRAKKIFFFLVELKIDKKTYHVTCFFLKKRGVI